jgi:hypothetical protein
MHETPELQWNREVDFKLQLASVVETRDSVLVLKHHLKNSHETIRFPRNNAAEE